MGWFEIIIYLLILLWIISFSYNTYYFFTQEDTELDTVFVNLSKTFEEAYQKLDILEGILGKSLSYSRKRLSFYENNARKTRRKYRYYADYIEPSMVKLFIGKEGSLFKKCWKELDEPVRYHYINLYIVLILILVVSIVAILFTMGWWGILLIFMMAGLILRTYNFIIRLNFIFFYILLDGILIAFKQDRGKLMKNVALIQLMTSSWFGSKNGGGYVVGAAGVASFGGYSSGGSFGGFGGGSFGGGGAGGSW